MREFLHVDDLADACLFLMEHYSDDSHINVGTGVDLPIRELAEKVRDVVYPEARACASTRRSPTARRARCSTSPSSDDLGWSPSIDLDTGIRTTYQWFLDQQAAHADLRGVAQPVAVGSGTS